MLDAGIYEQLSRLVIAMKQKSSQNMAGNRTERDFCGIFRFPGVYAGR